MSKSLANVPLSKRSMGPISPIRQRLDLQGNLDKELKAKGLKPTIKFSIGQPR